MINTIDFEKSIISPSNDTIYGNGIYVSENKNKIDNLNKLENVLFLERYVGENIQYLNLNDAKNIRCDKCQLINSFTISMWIFPLFEESRLYPISILAKSNDTTLGEINLSITVDNRLCFYYEYNDNKICTIKSKSKITIKAFTFIIISKTNEGLYIYINDKLDTYQQLNNQPVFTLNPLILGYNKNTKNYYGLIENLALSNKPITNIQSYLDIYYKHPNIYIFKIEEGTIKYTNFSSYDSNNTGLKMIEQSKNIIGILSQYLNGFTYNFKNNTVLYYISISKNTTALNITFIENYQKTCLLQLDGNLFIKQITTYPKQNNVLIENGVEAHGWLTSNNGEMIIFNKGNVLCYDYTSEKYDYANLSDKCAINILNNFKQIIGYIETDKYIFYVSYSQMRVDNSISNKFKMKMLSYNLGGINTEINFNTNNLSEIKPINSNTTNAILDINSSDIFEINFNNVEIAEKPLLTNNDEYLNLICSTLFVYNINKNITPILYKPFEQSIPTLPKLVNSYNIDFEYNTNIDLINILLNKKIDLNNQVIFNYNKLIVPGMYYLSLVTNSYILLKINNKEYTINSSNPIHILIHNYKTLLEIEISFYYDKISQIVKFMLKEQ